MKTLRFLHTADWHADLDSKKQNKLEASLKQIVEYCKKVKVEAIIHAGDIWERKQSYADNSGVPLVVKYLRELSHLVNFIFITKGNNSHDEPGSVALLHQLEPNIYAYEYPVCLAIGKDAIRDLLRFQSIDETFDYIVSLVPYPTKAMFLSDTSIDNNNADFIQKFEQVFELIGDVTQPYTCPKILGFHGNVVGSRLSSGQSLVSQDIMVAPSTLEKAKADYYALGHIHLRQEISPWMFYSGSIYNKSWGETEQKSFEVIEYLDREFTSDQIMLTSARPMMTVESFWDNDLNDFHFTSVEPENNPYENSPKNFEVRFRCKIKENDRGLITEEKINRLKEVYGNDVKIEFNILPTERESRSEKIMNCRELKDEVTEYATVIDADVFSTGTNENFLKPSLIEKVAQLQEEVVL